MHMSTCQTSTLANGLDLTIHPLFSLKIENSLASCCSQGSFNLPPRMVSNRSGLRSIWTVLSLVRYNTRSCQGDSEIVNKDFLVIFPPQNMRLKMVTRQGVLMSLLYALYSHQTQVNGLIRFSLNKDLVVAHCDLSPSLPQQDWK